MDERMTLEQVRDELMTQREIEGDRPITKFYERIIDAIDAHRTQPAQAVDVGEIREVIADLRAEQKPLDPAFKLWADKLTRAIGNAQAEGFAGFQIVENADVPDGEIWIYDKSKITTQATPNAHE